MNDYLIPANSKKGQLIFNVFRPVDLIIVVVGATVSLLMMIAVPGEEFWKLLIKLLPVGIALLLVIPIPFYHNVLVFLQELYLYFSSQRVYRWKGWCAKYVSKNNARKFAEDWIPIKGIQNGEIILDNGFRVTGVKIRPRNIFILDYDSQSNAIFNLRNFYNTLDYPFWLIVSDRPVDINIYLAQLKLLYNSVQSQAIRKLVREDIDKANLFMSKEVNVTDTEYFILFKERRPEIIQKRIQNMVSGLAGAGLQSSQTSNDDLRVLLDGFMNGGDSTNFGTVMSNI